MADINLSRITKTFGAHRAVDDVSLEIRNGEFVALLGPSGCGKTTLLRLLAGFEEPDAGDISLGGTTVAAPTKGIMVAPEDRNLGIVFQSYALWPHMSVARNVGYPLEVRGLSKADRDRKVREALATVSLVPFADRAPAELSGGQRQRVALARCLVMEPRAVLLDEPLANLDVHLRETMQQAFLEFHRRTGATMIYVTHDQAEAMTMADRIAVMDKGRIRQMAAPETLYREPGSEMVAGFVGAGAVLPIEDYRAETGGQEAGAKRCQVRLGGAEIGVRACPSIREDIRANDLGLCLRPEDVQVSNDGALAGVVDDCVYLGGRFRLGVRLGMNQIVPVYTNNRVRIGETVRLAVLDGWVFSRGEAA